MSSEKYSLSCGAVAAENLAPYEKDISDNFEISMHVGKLIAAWDRPRFVAVSDATHMRDDDYVVGVEFNGHYRCYPLWITDNYHMINDRIDGEPILFSTCERCQSGSAFISCVGGEPAKFSAMGMYNASLTMVDRKHKKKKEYSLWLHYEGVAIDGPENGKFLDQLPSYHMTWQEWVSAHPETDVMLAPNDPHHRDARHGHGREEYFSRPGMDMPLARTITGSFDQRYPENEIVLGINIDAGIRAYPLLEVKREGGVVNERLGDLPVVVFCGPRPDQVTMSAFLSVANERELTFERFGEQFRDQETGSCWTIEGKAVDGPLKGSALAPLRWQYVRWHAWVYPHPETDLFQSNLELPQYPAFPDDPIIGNFRELLEKLSGIEPNLSLSHVIPALMLPHEASAGICVYAAQDRLNLYAFSSPEAAADYVDMQGAWYCWPFAAKLARKQGVRIGSFVLESDPSDQYAEPTQTVHYPDNQTEWSMILQHTEFAPQDEPSVEGPYTALVNYLKAKRHDVVEVAFLPHSQLRVGVRSAVAASLEGDRFAIYHCDNEAAANSVAEEVTHAFAIGSWVFRSIPVLMYAEPHYEMGQLPDEEITWSPLLCDEEYQTTLRKFLIG